MAHPHAKQCMSGQERAKSRYADGGVAGDLADKAADAKSDLEGTMRYRADEISNPSNVEKPSVYMARRRMKGDDPFKGITPTTRGID